MEEFLEIPEIVEYLGFTVRQVRSCVDGMDKEFIRNDAALDYAEKEDINKLLTQKIEVCEIANCLDINKVNLRQKARKKNIEYWFQEKCRRHNYWFTHHNDRSKMNFAYRY